MTTNLRRSITKAIREGLTYAECWEGDDMALIACWERGRQLRDDPRPVTWLASDKPPSWKELAARAGDGELVSLPWSGGTEGLEELPTGKKPAKRFGTLRYLAMWQGLRGEDLDIAMHAETEITCSRTMRTVTFRLVATAAP